MRIWSGNGTGRLRIRGGNSLQTTPEIISRYVFALPGFLFFSFAVLIPFLLGIDIAFTDWNGINPNYNYVGLENFKQIFADSRLLQPIVNTLKFGLLGVAANNVLTLGLALLVNSGYSRLNNIAKTVFFIPVCLSNILAAFSWGFIYRNVLSSVFNVNSPLGSITWVIPSIVLIGIWNTMGINMLIYLAALKNVPTELYEAATIDGATDFKKFRYVTIPLITPAFTVCVTLTLTAYLREFAMTLTATGGGPAGYSQTISIYIFQNLFSYSKAGYGQAVAFLFMLILIIIGNSVSTFFRKREVEY